MIADTITALTDRITQLHAVCSRQAATIQALQRQLAEAQSAGASRQWTAEEVVKTFSVYDPGKVEAIMKALNERGAPDSGLAAAVAKAMAVLDRSSAVEMLNTIEHEAFATPAPPPAPGSLAARMIETTAQASREPSPAIDSAEERFEAVTAPEITPEGFAVDGESGKPIRPLTVADLAIVPRKPQGGMADEKVEAPV